MNYLAIQKDVISKYKIVISENSTCYGRTHAHCDGTRRICKWKQSNGLVSTFTLLHEVGHIMTHTNKMRRCESEYYATIWALEECKKYGLTITDKIINEYQRYIDMELQRGLMRNGCGYRDSYSLKEYNPSEIIEVKIKEPKAVKQKFFIL